MFKSEQQAWSHLSDLPVILACSARADWRGFVFHEIEVPPEGRFDNQQTLIALSMTCGPMKVRRGSDKSAFLDHPTDPMLSLPDQHARGAWKGVQRGLHLMLEPEVIERFTGRSYRESSFRHLQGQQPAIKNLMRALHIDVQAGHPSGPALGESIVCALIYNLLTENAVSYLTKPHQPSVLTDVHRLTEWIEANLTRSITLDELANEAGVSVRHLCRTFQMTTGQSPYNYILIRRIERAKQLIQAGQLSLQEVAVEVGFAHQAHMADTFRKITGTTPLHFRNKK